MRVFGRPSPTAIAAVADSPQPSSSITARLLCDEWDAMRECHDILCRFPAEARLRIIEAVSRRLGDEDAVTAHR